MQFPVGIRDVLVGGEPVVRGGDAHRRAARQGRTVGAAMPVLTDPQGWFTLEVPDGWDMATEDSVTTLRQPGRGRASSTSRARATPAGRQPSFGGADFLARFLRSLGLEVDEEAIAQRAGPGLPHLLATAARRPRPHWWFWSVTDDETALLISYTLPARRRAGEVDEVDEMVRSVRLYHSAPVH